MISKNMKMVAIITLVLLGIQVMPAPMAEASLFHATSKAAARKIMQKGFAGSRMRETSRFGRGVYLSEKRDIAKLEAKEANQVIRFKNVSPKKVWQLDRPTPEKIHTVLPKADLRGSVKKQVIGPKLGHRLGRAASRENVAIKYTSAQNSRGANLMIPKNVYEKNPKLLKLDAPVRGN